MWEGKASLTSTSEPFSGPWPQTRSPPWTPASGHQTRRSFVRSFNLTTIIITLEVGSHFSNVPSFSDIDVFPDFKSLLGILSLFQNINVFRFFRMSRLVSLLTFLLFYSVFSVMWTLFRNIDVFLNFSNVPSLLNIYVSGMLTFFRIVILVLDC